MKKRNFVFAGIVTALLLTGCQSNTNTAETEALKQQIAQLEQQVAELQNSTAPENNAGLETSAPEVSADTADPAPTDTTSTLEELTALVDAYSEKALAASPTGTSSEDMEQFFNLKQEGNQIDNALDLHEDELERQYRDGTLTREDYKALERELERLEDKLDDSEDILEHIFGIDD